MLYIAKMKDVINCESHRRDHGYEKTMDRQGLAIVLEGLKGECQINELYNVHGCKMIESASPLGISVSAQ